MENLFSLKYGVAGICVLLTLLILVRVGEFLWRLHEKEEQKKASDLPKLRLDLKRAFSALKILAGDRWPQIRDEIMKDDF